MRYGYIKWWGLADYSAFRLFRLMLSFIGSLGYLRKVSTTPYSPAGGGQASFFFALLEKRSFGKKVPVGKLTFALLLLLLSITGLRAQIPGWQWATGPMGQSIVSAIGADAGGNAFAAGHFLGKLSFDNDTLINYLGPYQEVFICKYNAQGLPLWAKSGIGYADANSLGTDINGNVYLLGTFYNDSIFFDNQVLVNPNAGAMNSNIFLVKFDGLGNLQWAQNLGGINNDVAAGISTDHWGNVYVTGSFTGDSLRLGNVTVQHLGANDVFTAKFNSSGSALWIKNIGSAFLNGSAAVCTDASGDVFVTGYFLNNAIYIGSVNSTLTSPYSSNVFIVKYDSTGNTRWAKYAGGNNGNGPGGIAADAQGNVYVTGYFSDTIAVSNDTLAGYGLQNIFTAKYNSAGTLIWAQSTGGSYIDQSTGIACDENGDTYITGYFQSDTVSFGNINLLNPVGNQVTFLAEYDNAGNAISASSPAGNSNNTGVALCYNGGSVYLAGNFQSADIIFSNDTLLPSQRTIFLAKTDTIVIVTGEKVIPDIAENITVFPNPSNGNFYIRGITPGDKMEVFNLLGQSVFTANVQGNIYAFSLDDKAKGVYLYRITNNGAVTGQGKLVFE